MSSVFQNPVSDGPFVEAEYSYASDWQVMLALVESLLVPWHPEKGDSCATDVDWHHQSLTRFGCVSFKVHAISFVLHYPLLALPPLLLRVLVHFPLKCISQHRYHQLLDLSISIRSR